MTTPANPDDLTAWLQAQLDTDVRRIDEYEAYMTERAAAAGSYVLVTPPGWQPGEPFDPDRQRAEVDAKRRILDWHSTHKDGPFAGIHCEQCEDTAPCMTVRLLALPYADRPGYQERWRP